VEVEREAAAIDDEARRRRDRGGIRRERGRVVATILVLVTRACTWYSVLGRGGAIWSD
jgi:hypothetical protein